MSRGNWPRALNRSTWKISVETPPILSNTCCSGVLDTRPPSQNQSVPTCTIGNAGGSAPLAITCSGLMTVSVVSK